MATSGTYAFSMTARDVVTHAMAELGIIATGTEPDASEMDAGVQNLNLMLKSWQNEDSLWRETTDEEVTVEADSPSVELDDAVRSVTGVRLAMSSTYQRPLQMWTRADYLQVPNKAQTGTPMSYYLSVQRGSATLFVWPIPTTDTDLLVDYIRGIETVTDPTETLDVPDDWLEAVWTGLAVRLAGRFGVEAPPELVTRAAGLYQQLIDQDRPDSYFMGPWDDRYYG